MFRNSGSDSRRHIAHHRINAGDRRTEVGQFLIQRRYFAFLHCLSPRRASVPFLHASRPVQQREALSGKRLSTRRSEPQPCLTAPQATAQSRCANRSPCGKPVAALPASRAFPPCLTTPETRCATPVIPISLLCPLTNSKSVQKAVSDIASQLSSDSPSVLRWAHRSPIGQNPALTYYGCRNQPPCDTSSPAAHVTPITPRCSRPSPPRPPVRSPDHEGATTVTSR